MILILCFAESGCAKCKMCSCCFLLQFNVYIFFPCYCVGCRVPAKAERGGMEQPSQPTETKRGVVHALGAQEAGSPTEEQSG